MVHYAPKKPFNNTSIINHLGINTISITKKIKRYQIICVTSDAGCIREACEGWSGTRDPAISKNIKK